MEATKEKHQEQRRKQSKSCSFQSPFFRENSNPSGVFLLFLCSWEHTWCLWLVIYQKGAATAVTFREISTVYFDLSSPCANRLPVPSASSSTRKLLLLFLPFPYYWSEKSKRKINAEFLRQRAHRGVGGRTEYGHIHTRGQVACEKVTRYFQAL